ncbi:BTB/POZ domain-containing protein 19 [Gnomoniopsis smithogilvyi]|uniref:BTB/POZ domain-containing protein 19 n=1 Tax=Gnomoniopsis smithogilvyi TaxID=1191159 RepID=A0A9W9CZ59_9PEZI|nr:BTB/POZ domain-containing protein 19 [Gnomoniopsis smithogilvyi]
MDLTDPLQNMNITNAIGMFSSPWLRRRIERRAGVHPMGDTYSPPLIECPPVYHGLAKLLSSGQFSDYTIKCGDKELHVHRNIISGQSRFFAAACKNRWMEGRSQILELPDDDPEAVEAMVQFMYHGVYNDPLFLESKYNCAKGQLEVRGTTAQLENSRIPSLPPGPLDQTLPQLTRRSRLSSLPKLVNEDGNEE